MICDICKSNDAVFRIQENSPVGSRVINICLECAATKGLNIKKEEIGELITNVMQNIFSNNNPKLSIPFVKFLNTKCTQCGQELSSITENNEVGCPACYLEFNKIINSIIYKTNNSIEYKGHLPEGYNHIRKYKINLIELKRQLRDAIKMEDFENAAKLRDKIKELKEKHIEK